ncbi:NADH:flavin oxidoreductase/NADH oxidase [Paenibacillus lemnae]|uniref:NADH:flavin oxidoreductase/NADH oxidase n=1 Tax=Paenibacillus lemnae TaxID=1330551 RepID=A0A848M8T0_PAELE|nr:NADH:flavin oxidoreductase/NADH oxidase [Paenibacillus lemnae]NMO95914.1 NADH:flavin oxidoreductase/NADH oxidase [Paenibacillus lemnae]
MADLFTPYSFKNLTLKNRIVMPPMCQYSVQAEDGNPNDWHYVHYVSRAVGGTGLIIIEMTAIEPDGRISDQDTGIWSDEHIPAYRKIVDSVHSYGTKIGIQLGHAGRKAQDAEPPMAPSCIPFSSQYGMPRALSTDEVEEKIQLYREGARRAVEAGFDTVEIHGAHGYLIHQFHSPLTNQRKDEYGKDYALFGEKVVQAVKEVLPEGMPIIMRVSAKEYVEDGYGIDYIASICERYKHAGVDIFHITSGGEGPVGSDGGPKAVPAYQVDLADEFKKKLHTPVIAVGLLDEFEVAQNVILEGKADLVAVGRGMLKDPYWALHASEALQGEQKVPKAYERGFPRKNK